MEIPDEHSASSPAAFHTGNRDREGSSRRRRLEQPRPREGGAGLHRCENRIAVRFAYEWHDDSDSYIDEYRARGVSAESVAMNNARLERWGRWLKQRRPRVGIERIDADLVAYFT
jgi:hypothetical protein